MRRIFRNFVHFLDVQLSKGITYPLGQYLEPSVC